MITGSVINVLGLSYSYSVDVQGILSGKCITLKIHDYLFYLQERASNNNTFVYVKIPEVSLRVSYKVNLLLY